LRGRATDSRFVGRGKASQIGGFVACPELLVPELPLQEFRQLLGRDLAFHEDLVQDARADGLAGMRGDDCASPVLVPEEMVAAFDPQNAETGWASAAMSPEAVARGARLMRRW
jgi:hypothetical protein